MKPHLYYRDGRWQARPLTGPEQATLVLCPREVQMEAANWTHMAAHWVRAQKSVQTDQGSTA